MWAYPVSLITYLIVAGIVVFLSIKLSDFVDLLDKKTKISGAFLGGILLAAVTSLPELFTSLSSTLFLHENNYVMGNILGSDLFNTCLFAIIYLFFFKSFIKSKVNKTYLLSCIFLMLMYGAVSIATFVFNTNKILWYVFNPISIVIFIIYALALWKTPKVEEAENKETTNTWPVKKIVVLFVIFSVLLIGASIGITFLTNWVVDVYHIPSKAFAGALFLGVATSLPELTATITLCKKKNFNAAFGNIIGSNIFNFLILTIADIFSFVAGKPVYAVDYASTLLIIFGACVTVVVFLSILLKNKLKAKENIARLFYGGCGVLFVGMYVAFLVLSTVN